MKKTLLTSTSLAATATAASGAVVQITLTDNYLSSSTNSLNADLTGDGTNDVTFSSVMSGFTSFVGLLINGNAVYASYFSSFYASAQFASFGVGTPSTNGFTPQDITYLNPITFSDARINGGNVTEGFLEVNAFNFSSSSHTVRLTRLIFDDASTTRPTFASVPGVQTEWAPIPEPSSLALLALGAGGLLHRRRRHAA